MEAIHAFVERWKERGYEKGESQAFWLDLLHDVLDITTPGGCDLVRKSSQIGQYQLYRCLYCAHQSAYRTKKHGY